MPKFVRSENHEIIFRLLSATETGDTVSYRQMSEAVGFPVDGSTPPLRSALHRALMEDGAVFANEPKVGYRRLSPEETVQHSDHDRHKVHRSAKRGALKLETVDAEFASMDPRHRLKYAVGLSLFAAITAATSKAAVKRLSAHVARTDARPLPFAETLAAFLSQSKKEPPA